MPVISATPLSCTPISCAPIAARAVGAAAQTWVEQYAEGLNIEIGEGATVGLQRRSGSYALYSHLGGAQYARCRLDNDGTNRLSWRSTSIIQMHDIAIASALTVSGAHTLSLYSSTTGFSAAYVGNRAIRLQGADAYAEGEVTGFGDLYICCTFRNSAGHIRVDIDGDQSLVNELSDLGNGYKAIDTYDSSSLLRRQIVRAASGLPQGTYTVRCTRAGAKNESSSGLDVYVEAIAITSTMTNARWQPPAWQTGVAVAVGDEVQNAGYFYRATTAGTTGATAPTHTSGNASDGNVNWQSWSESTYLIIASDVDYASEREYAMFADIGGTTSGIGGQTHGNEAVTARTILVDGVALDIDSADYTAVTEGAAISISETLQISHDSDATLASATLNRTYTPGAATHNLTMSITTTSVDIGWLYPAMLPIVRYDGSAGEDVFDTVRYGDSEITLGDYVSQNDPSVDIGAALSAAAIGKCHSRGRNLMWAVRTTAASVNNYQNNGAAASVAANVNNESGTGGTDWQVKLYFARAIAASPEAFMDGAVLALSSTHVIGVEV